MRDHDDEVLTDIEALRRQLSANEAMLLHLRAVAWANTLNYLLASIVFLLLIALCLYSFAAVLFPGAWLSRLNHELVQFAGPLCLLAAFGALQVARYLFNLWVQRSELRMVVRQQCRAIDFAEKVLESSHEDKGYSS